ncbi:unnamed protein product [Moneuplotes crassus]|uniref:Kelch motif family protein n=1 Tax=Euplotes crassus TaxID=5936 RepID=A0AAD1U3I2_EUPCR|nr:unnamed protein product [Moneuplotes crassus]
MDNFNPVDVFQRPSRNFFQGGRTLGDSQPENGSFPSLAPDLFSKIDSFKINEYQKNQSKILKGGNTKRKSSLVPTLRKNKSENGPKTFRSERRKSFFNIGLNDIKDKILKNHLNAPEIAKRIPNYSLYGIKPIERKKKVQPVTKEKPSKVTLAPPHKLLHMLENLYKSKKDKNSQIHSQRENLKSNQTNFGDICQNLKKDLLAWVDSYLEEFQIEQMHVIKKGIEETSKAYDTLSEEIFQLNRLITATRQGLETNKSIDARLLKKIQKVIKENTIHDLEYEKQCTLLYEQELNKVNDQEITIKFGGYQASNYGRIYSPRPYIDKYGLSKIETNSGKPNKKIRLTKWKSDKVMEYDVSNKKWILTDTHIKPDVKQFSSTVFFNNLEMMVLGGLDPDAEGDEHFTSKVYSLNEVGDTPLNKVYFSDQLMSMITPRGCFCTTILDDKILAIGGLNDTERILNKCELYNKRDDCWHPMPSLNIARNNASAIKLNDDSVYCFGGCDETGIINSIELFSFSLNEWSVLEIKLPNPVSLCSVFKLNETKLLILGGLIKEYSEKTTAYKSDQVLVFDTAEPNFYKSQTNLPEDCVSLYPAFYDEGKLFIVNEIPDLFLPEIITYDLAENLSSLLPNQTEGD